MKDELIRNMQLDNGLSIDFYDRSNRYFGDYHRVSIEVRCRIVISETLFSEVADAQKARAVLGEQLLVTRTLERMGVASADLAEVREALIDSYLHNALPYLAVPDYPARLLRKELASKSPRGRTCAGAAMIEIAIDSLAFGGAGVGRHQGKTIFVPFTAPGDRLNCELIEEKKNFAHGRMVELLVPSPLRRPPPCPVFGECGGCQWQHLPYPEQGRWKERILGDMLQRRCGISSESLRPLRPAVNEWGYRSRVQFKCRQTPQGFVLGFYRGGSHYVIDVRHCPITDPRLNEVMGLLRPQLAAAPFSARIPQLDLAVDDRGRVRGVLHFLGEDVRQAIDYLRPLAKEGNFALYLQTGRKETLRHIAGDEDLFVEVGNPTLALAYGPGGFAQVNLEQNRALVAEVTGVADALQAKRILDLFCGMGNFALPLAASGAWVVGVEDYAPSIDKARQNARRLGLATARFEVGAAEGAADRFGPDGPFDLVLLDPPRAGAAAVMKDLLRTRPAQILYISCDPATLVRDLATLLSGGYRLEWSRPFDLFPQTYHLESVSLLRRIF